MIYGRPSLQNNIRRGHLQEFLVKGDDMDDEKIGRGLGPP
jgi:hypothetical protein